MGTLSTAGLLLAALLSAPQEETLGMSARYERAQTRFEAGDLRGAVEDLDAILADPRLAGSEAPVRLLAAQYRIPLGSPRQALEDVAIAEELAGRAGSVHSAADLCHAAGVRTLAYLNLGLHGLAGESLGVMFERHAELQGAGSPHLVRETIFLDTVNAVFLMSLEEYRELDQWVELRLADEDVYREPSAHSVKLELTRALGLWARTRLEPELVPAAVAALDAVEGAEVAMQSDRLRAAHTLADLAITRSDLEAADRWLARTAALLGEEGARRDPEAHLRQVTLATRFAIESGAPPDRLTGLAEGIRSALDAIVQPVPRRGGTGFLSYTTRRAAIGELLRCELADGGEQGPERALSVLLSMQDRGTLFRLLGGGSTTLDEVRSALLGGDEPRLILVYFPAPERTHLFVVDAESVQHLPLPLHDRIETAARELVFALRRPAGSEQADGRRRLRADLAKMLLPDELRERLRSVPRATVVASAFRSTLPFEALPFELAPGDGGSLGTAIALDHLPSLSVGVKLAQRRSKPVEVGAGSVLVLVGDLSTESGPDLGARIARDPAQLVGGYPDESLVLLARGEATRAELVSRASSSEVLQFFTHGRYDRKRERPAGLVLAPAEGDDGFYGADEIEGRAGEGPLNAPSTVILTSCGAGRERVRVGDAGANDLAGALFLASDRTRCVLLSSFDLDVEATRRFSVAFHDALRAGRTVAESARRARSAVASDERFADPHYHSLLQVTGLGHAPVFR